MATTEKNHYLQVALDLTEQSIKSGGGPFAAIVVKDSQVVGRGHNQVTINHDPTAHAEIVAIRDACNNLGTHQLEGCSLYVNSKPCPMCLSAAYWANVTEIFYAASADDVAAIGFKDAYILYELNRDEAFRDLPLIQVELFRDRAVQQLQQWKEDPEHQEY
jgi:tRNA(Arg) A34 adenosine deaminase TadA